MLGEYRNRINTNLTLQVEQQGDTVVLCEHFSLNPPMVSRQVNDLALGVLYKLCRTGQFTIVFSTVRFNSGPTLTDSS